MDIVKDLGKFMWRSIRFCLRQAKRVALVVSIIFGLFLLTAGGIGAYIWFSAGNELKHVPALRNPAAAPLPGPVSVYSNDGVKLGTSVVQNRVILAPKEIPQVMGRAVVAIEDQRFYEHHGVDYYSLARATLADVRHKAPEQGASTITMQYIRNVYLSRQKTFSRKLREVALAVQLESAWTKERILDAYLNTVYFGEGAYGVGAAAKHYFGVPAGRLTAGQAAFLAGVVQNPEKYDPHVYPKNALVRRNTVLDEMFYQGYLTRPQVLHFKTTRLGVKKGRNFGRPAEPILFNYAYEEAKQRLSPQQVARGGYRVVTTFNMHLIRLARTVLAKQYANLGKKKPALALAQVDPRSGAIVTLAQTRYKRDFNLAAQAQRQPGSAVKPFTLATYLSNGGNLSDSVDDTPLKVVDAHGKTQVITPTYNVNSVLEAITFSQNPVFYRLYQKEGGRNVLALEKRLGMRHMDANPAAALGGTRRGASALEMAGAYAAFANGGSYEQPYSVAVVSDNLGNALYRHKTATAHPVAPEVARRVNAALQNVVGKGFPELVANLSGVRANYPLAGKTGTSEDNADAWFVGYTPAYATAVWTGFPSKRIPMDNLVTGGVFGKGVPAEVFNAYSVDALKWLHTPPLKFPSPKQLVQVPRVRGETTNAAIAQMQKFGVRYVLVATQSLDRRPGIVLRTSPHENAWIAASKTVNVYYTTNERPVPDLVGKDYLQARRLLGRFTRVKEVLEVSNRFPIGTVVAQYPLAGVSASIDAPMRIAIAVRRAPPHTIKQKVPYVPSNSELASLQQQILGLEKQAVVPNVIGLSTASARQVAASLGLRLRSSNGNGVVASQDPVGGTIVNKQNVVHVSVAL